MTPKGRKLLISSRHQYFHAKKY